MEKPDAPAVAVLIRIAFAAQFVVTDPPPSTLGVTENDVAAHLNAGGGAVAEAGGKMMGSTLWTEQDDGLYLALLRIHLSTRLVLLDNRRLFGVCGFIETTCHAHPGYREPTFVTMEKRLAPAAPPGLLPPGEREIW